MRTSLPARLGFGLAAVLLAGTAAPAAQAAPATPSAPVAGQAIAPGCAWSVQQLPVPAGLNGGHVLGASSNGRAAGYAVDADGLVRPIAWTAAGAVSQISMPENTPAVASDVNNSGAVLINTQPATGVPVPYVYVSGRLVRLAAPKTGFASAAAINDTFIVAGTVVAPAEHVVTWNVKRPNIYRDLGGDLGAARVSDISNNGTLAGISETTSSDFRTRAITGTAFVRLKPLAGLNPEVNSTAYGAAGSYVIGAGQLAGAAGSFTPVLWKNGVPAALPPLFSGIGVNSAGVAVGSTDAGKAAVWANGALTTLPALPGGGVAFGDGASAISDTGTVFGQSIVGDTINPVYWTCA